LEAELISGIFNQITKFGNNGKRENSIGPNLAQAFAQVLPACSVWQAKRLRRIERVGSAQLGILIELAHVERRSGARGGAAVARPPADHRRPRHSVVFT
jgi:hypothetical protein